MGERCLYDDVAGEYGCALLATADSPPPERVQMGELILENHRLKEKILEYEYVLIHVAGTKYGQHMAHMAREALGKYHVS